MDQEDWARIFISAAYKLLINLKNDRTWTCRHHRTVCKAVEFIEASGLILEIIEDHDSNIEGG